MASAYKQPNGGYIVQFIVDGKRQFIRLGKCKPTAASKAESCISDLVTSRKLDEQPSETTRKWLQEIDAKLHAKLASCGLTQHREITTLGPFTKNYIDGRSDATEATKRKFRVTRQYLVDKFGETKDISAVTEADADDFRVYLLGQQTSRLSAETMGENTVRKHCQIAGQFFNRAVKMRLIDRNPFQSLPSTVQRNPTRDHFISQDDMQRLLDACPDTQWRLLFALSRYAGLRCPTESLALTWDDINWDREELLVHSSKTKRYIGKGQRIVPIFADLLPILRDAWETMPDPDSPYVISRYRDTSANLRTHSHRIMKRAGLKPWPKCFQNLRASLATELVQFVPMNQAAEWTGHSISTMQKFYLQITPEHREAARKRQQQLKEAGDKALQKALQSGQDMGRNDTQAESECLVLSIRNLSCPTPLMGDEGLTKTPKTQEKQHVLTIGAAKSAAVQIRTSLPMLAVDLAAQLTAAQCQELIQLLASPASTSTRLQQQGGLS